MEQCAGNPDEAALQELRLDFRQVLRVHERGRRLSEEETDLVFLKGPKQKLRRLDDWGVIFPSSHNEPFDVARGGLWTEKPKARSPPEVISDTLPHRQSRPVDRQRWHKHAREEPQHLKAGRSEAVDAVTMQHDCVSSFLRGVTLRYLEREVHVMHHKERI